MSGDAYLYASRTDGSPICKDCAYAVSLSGSWGCVVGKASMSARPSSCASYLPRDAVKEITDVR